MNLPWPAILREDGIRIELLCEHGCGHPSKKLSGERWNDSWMGIHGCCGCCSRYSAEHALSEMHYEKHPEDIEK